MARGPQAGEPQQPQQPMGGPQGNGMANDLYGQMFPGSRPTMDRMVWGGNGQPTPPPTTNPVVPRPVSPVRSIFGRK